MNKNLTITVLKRLAEIAFFGCCFWLIHYWVYNYKDKLPSYADFALEYDKRMQGFDTFFFSGLLTVFILGYYLNITALNMFDKRLTGADNNLVYSNRMIIYLRIGVLACMYISLGIAAMTLSNLPDATTAFIFVIPSIPIMFGLGPCYVFYKLTDIFTLKYCVTVTALILAITFIASYFRFPPTLAFVFSGVPLLATFNRKYGEASYFFKNGHRRILPGES